MKGNRHFGRLTSTPVDVPTSKRNHDVIALTSLPAGKMVPVAAIPMLREDSLRGSVTLKVEMLETKELLMNPVTMRARAICVPWLALERFQGSRDQFDRSWMGKPKTDDVGATVIPFIETHAMGAHGSNPIYKYMGYHGKATDQVNTMPLESVNTAWNWLARLRSKELAARLRLDTSLPPAFWPSSRFAHLVPDFDQAVIDGEVALNVVNSRLKVSGISLAPNDYGDIVNATRKDATTTPAGVVYPFSRASGGVTIRTTTDVAGTALPDIYAEMAENGITISLSSLKMAKQMQSFAKLREMYDGYDDEYIIDMLMDGLSIPDQALKQPFLVADESDRFEQAKRYATNAPKRHVRRGGGHATAPRAANVGGRDGADLRGMRAGADFRTAARSVLPSVGCPRRQRPAGRDAVVSPRCARPREGRRCVEQGYRYRPCNAERDLRVRADELEVEFVRPAHRRQVLSPDREHGDG